MKFSYFAIIALCLFFSIMFPLNYDTSIAIKTEQVARDYADYLTTACYDGIHEVDFNEEYVFAQQKTRDCVKATFYESLFVNLNVHEDTNEELIKYYIPCMVMIDKNGFYINYNMPYESGSDVVYQNTMTSIQTWSNKYGNYIVQFFLSDNLLITDVTTGKVYEGNYQDIKPMLPSLDTLSFLENEETYEMERKYIVIGEIIKQVEYYINMHNSKNVIEKQYAFVIPETKESDWARMLEGSTVIAFMQGKQPQFKNTYLNIYSLAGSEIITQENYYLANDIFGNLYYHVKGCSAGSDIQSNQYTTMENCAKKGAFPCTECIY